MPHHNVVVFVPFGSEHYLTWLAQCANYCLAKKYEIVAVVSVWAEALAWVMSGRAEVAITPSRDLIPPDAVPRIEVVDEDPPPDDPPGRRRPRWRG